MSDLLTPRDVMVELGRLSKLLDDALAYAHRAAREHADADDAYRVAQAKAMLEAKDRGATDKAAAAHADSVTSEVRRRARYAAQMAQVSVEAIRSRRAQLSALQTAASSLRAEIEMARYGPEVAA